jgi:hypothetical protein
MSTYKTDYTSEGLDRLLSTLKGGTKLEALVASYVDRVQELEDAAFPVYAQWDIETATGDRLDRIGQILLVPRSGLTDEPYRLRLRAEIAILTSIGTEYDLVRVIQLLTGAPAKANVEYYEFFPKTAYVRVIDHPVSGTVGGQAVTAALLRRAAPAGTEVHYLYSLTESSDDNVFKFSSTADTTETSVSYGTENGSLAGIN